MPIEVFQTKKEALKFANKLMAKDEVIRMYKSGYSQQWIVEYAKYGIFGA